MNLKKLVAGALATISCLGCSFAASANSAVTVNITVKEGDAHNYSVFQLMVGDTDGTNLTAVQWGSSAADGKTGYVSHEDLTAVEKIAALSTDAEKARALSSYVDFSKSIGTVKAGTPLAVEEGWYVMKDQDTLTTEDYTIYIAKAVLGKDVEIERKAAASVPTATKTVNGKEVDDAAQGDTLSYSVTGTLPDNYDAYTKYQYVLTDKFDAGITIDKNSVKVMADSAEITGNFTVDLTGQTLTVSCSDLKAIASLTKDSKIVFTYTGTLNASANTSKTGNTNSAAIAYSNDPNSDTTGTTANSVADVASVHTYDLVINQKDEKGADLSGVGVTLYKKGTDGKYSAVGTEKVGSSATWENVDNGDYAIVESTVPSGYKAFKGSEFTTADGTTLNGKLFTISADPAVPSLSVTEGVFDTLTADAGTGVITASLNSYTSATLPVTGAISLVCLGLAGAGIGAAALVLHKKGKEDEE